MYNESTDSITKSWQSLSSSSSKFITSLWKTLSKMSLQNEHSGVITSPGIRVVARPRRILFCPNQSSFQDLCCFCSILFSAGRRRSTPTFQINSFSRRQPGRTCPSAASNLAFGTADRRTQASDLSLIHI